MQCQGRAGGGTWFLQQHGRRMVVPGTAGHGSCWPGRQCWETPVAYSMLVKSIFCPCFLCAVLLQSCLCKAFNKYPLKCGGDEQGNVKNNEMSLSLGGSSIDQPWRELVMRPTLPRENSNSLPLCSPRSPSL